MNAISIDSLRAEIDGLDDQIVELLNRRASLAVQIGRIKQQHGNALYVPSRERDVLARLMARSQGPLSDASISRIYRAVMASSLALEHHDKLMVVGRDPDAVKPVVRYLAGGNADGEHFADPVSAVAAFRASPGAMLVVEASLTEAAGVPLASAPVCWKGCFTIPGTGSIWHVYRHAEAVADGSRPATLCAVVQGDAGKPPAWIAELGCVACVRLPVTGDAGAILLECTFEMTAAEIAAGPARTAANHCEAVWLRD